MRKVPWIQNFLGHPIPQGKNKFTWLMELWCESLGAVARFARILPGADRGVVRLFGLAAGRGGPAKLF